MPILLLDGVGHIHTSAWGSSIEVDPPTSRTGSYCWVEELRKTHQSDKLQNQGVQPSPAPPPRPLREGGPLQLQRLLIWRASLQRIATRSAAERRCSLPPPSPLLNRCREAGGGGCHSNIRDPLDEAAPSMSQPFSTRPTKDPFVATIV